MEKKYEIEVIDVNALNYQQVTPETLSRRNGGYVPDDVVALSRRIAAADRLVIAAPYWDMSFPASLKVFIENVSLFNISFASNDTECYGLCQCKRLLYITTRGMNIASGSVLDQGTSYMKALSALWGLGDVITVSAENLDYSTPEQVEERLAVAIGKLDEVCRDF